MNIDINKRDMQEIVAQVAGKQLGEKLGPALAEVVDECMPAMRAGLRALLRETLAQSLAAIEIELAAGYLDDGERTKIREKYTAIIEDALARTEAGRADRP